MYLVSACLLGIPCRYDGKAKPCSEVIAFLQDKQYKAICPECLGGLTIPHPPAEICGGDGQDVLAGKAAVHNQKGANVTDYFIRGAEKVLEIAQKQPVEAIILKRKSPSCGTDAIYDGSFSKKLRPGFGVTAALLHQAGYCLLDEENVAKAVDE